MDEACANCEHGQSCHYGDLLDEDSDSGCHVCDDIGQDCDGFRPDHGEDIAL